MEKGRQVRIVVVGTSGAGKITLARTIAARLALPHIELDAINWQAGWRDLTRHDPAEFVRRVTEAIQADRWVVDGNYGPVRDIVWTRATHLVWLDYPRPVIMARVIRRSLLSAHRVVGRQSRAMAAHATAKPSDPLGLDHLGPPPPRDGGPPRAGGVCTVGSVAATLPARGTACARTIDRSCGNATR